MDDYYYLLCDLLALTEFPENVRDDRTGVGTYALFGARMDFDLTRAFPVLEEKATWFRGVVAELLWFLSGDTNVRALEAQGVNIWSAWADEHGDLGPVYGENLRRWRGADGREHDQIANVITSLRENPNSRRHCISMWNVGALDQMALHPCHGAFIQFDVDLETGLLSCEMFQRSADMFLGVPFNIASYALLTQILAAVCGYKPGTLGITLGNAHLYTNHVDQARELSLRRTLSTSRFYRAPELEPRVDLDLRGPYATTQDAVEAVNSLTADQIRLRNYDPLPAIKAPVAV